MKPEVNILQLGISIYFLFIILIIITIILKRKPILIGALGLLAVGIAETKSLMQGIEATFRGLLHTTADLLAIILLIGLVVAMTGMLKETGADTVMVKPFLQIKKRTAIFWLLGLALWFLASFLWPTPAVSLLGALILPLVDNSRLKPLGLAAALCIFGEGTGLSGDFIIQGAPALTAKAAGIASGLIIADSVPLVLGSGLIAALLAYWQMLRAETGRITETGQIAKIDEQKEQGEGVEQEADIEQEVDIEQEAGVEEKSLSSGKQRPASKFLAFFTVALYMLVIIWLLLSGIRGDSAAAVTGGAAVLVLITGSLLAGYQAALNRFVRYIQKGLRFSMGVFAPIVVIAGFFLLGTQQGCSEILGQTGPGYLERMAGYLAGSFTLHVWSCALIVILAAVLGAMSGSGFSALPLVGGLAAALGQTAGASIVQLAALGQAAAIWTDALVIPWGFPAVVGAITKTEPAEIAKTNILPWLAVLLFIFLWATAGYRLFL